MSKSVGLGDAVRLLGGHDSKLLSVLDTTVSWLMVGVAPVAQEVLGWFDHKADLSRLARDAFRAIYERRSGLSEHGRTDRVEAAHTITVIAAFFDELETVKLPTRLSKAEQIAIATRGVAMPDKFVILVMSAGRLLPAEGQAPGDFERGLHDYYQQMVTEVNEFLDGLAVAEELPSAERSRITEALRTVADGAVGRYRDSMLELSEFPDFQSWTQIRYHRATYARLIEVTDQLTVITEVMATLRDRYDGPEPDELRSRLAKIYVGDLQTRPTDVGPLPDDVRIPSLSELYVPPRFRVMEVTGPDQLGDDSRWEAQALRVSDPWEFLGDHLRSDDAARAPLCLVGECGSGSSSVLRLICAVLPPESFVPVRVDLKRKPELTEIEGHLAEALRAATGETPDWSSLVPQGKTIQRVVALDSFHNYVQATGTDQADLLERVAQFQLRERVRGRPVAVIIAGRTAVLGRARPPDGTLAIRLEPFDEPQVREWVKGWNLVNPAKPLVAESLLTHRDLTRQPLSLLVLAIHTAGGKAPGSRHEHLLHVLADREVMTHQPQLHQRERLTDIDISFLAAAAFAMFNSGDLWISEADLGEALAQARQRPESGLSDAAYLLSRFPFRRRGDQYAFTHSAIVDVLIARLTWDELRKIVNADGSVAKGDTSDEGLRALLSFQLLASRPTVVDFLTDMMADLGPIASRKVKGLLLRLFQEVPHPTDRAELVHRANLLQLLVCTPMETVLASELFPDSPDPVAEWRALTLLWESQLSTVSMRELLKALAPVRTEEKGERNVRLGPAQEGWEPGGIDPAWSHGDTD